MEKVKDGKDDQVPSCELNYYVSLVNLHTAEVRLIEGILLVLPTEKTLRWSIQAIKTSTG